MKQIYHPNATTNVHIRQQIQNDTSSSNENLAKKFGISIQTTSKWRNRDFVKNVSSKPNTIKYALPELNQQLIVSIRKSTWLPLDEIVEMTATEHNNIARSNVY